MALELPWFPDGDPYLPENSGSGVLPLHRYYGDIYQTYDCLCAIGIPQNLGDLFPFESEGFAVFPLAYLQSMVASATAGYLFIDRFTPDTHPWASEYSAKLWEILDSYTGYQILGGATFDSWVESGLPSPASIGSLEISSSEDKEPTVVTWLQVDPEDNSWCKRSLALVFGKTPFVPSSPVALYSVVVSGPSKQEVEDQINEASEYYLFDNFDFPKFPKEEMDAANEGFPLFSFRTRTLTYQDRVVNLDYYGWTFTKSDVSQIPVYYKEDLPWNPNQEPSVLLTPVSTNFEDSGTVSYRFPYDWQYVSNQLELNNSHYAIVRGVEYWTVIQRRSGSYYLDGDTDYLVDPRYYPIIARFQSDSSEQGQVYFTPESSKQEFALACLSPANNDPWGKGIPGQELGEYPGSYKPKEDLQPFYENIVWAKPGKGLISEFLVRQDQYFEDIRGEYFPVAAFARFVLFAETDGTFNCTGKQIRFANDVYFFYAGEIDCLPVAAFSNNEGFGLDRMLFMPHDYETRQENEDRYVPGKYEYTPQATVTQIETTRWTIQPTDPEELTHEEIDKEELILLADKYWGELEIIEGQQELKNVMPDSIRIKNIELALEAEKYSSGGDIEIVDYNGNVIANLPNTLATLIDRTAESLQALNYPGAFQSGRLTPGNWESEQLKDIEFSSLPELIAKVYQELQKTLGNGYDQIKMGSGNDKAEYKNLGDQLNEIIVTQSILFTKLDQLSTATLKSEIMSFEILAALGVKLTADKVTLNKGQPNETMLAVPVFDEGQGQTLLEGIYDVLINLQYLLKSRTI